MRSVGGYKDPKFFMRTVMNGIRDLDLSGEQVILLDLSCSSHLAQWKEMYR